MLELLRELVHRKPFRPIRIVMKSGDRYEVMSREKLAIGRSTAMLVLPPSDRVVRLSENDIELVYERRCAGREKRRLKPPLRIGLRQER